MHSRSLAIYFAILTFLCTAVIVGALELGKNGAYLAQVYMLTPALAALITRLFFYPPRFSDAALRFGRLGDYVRYWLFSLGIVVLFSSTYTVLGAVHWDFTGNVFLARLAGQFAAAGQDMTASLPPGFTAQTMLLVYFIGGLTVFNILPGLITGFGEEFGHRGFMFPLLFRIRPWVGLIIGGLIWFAWHLPLALVVPQTQAAQTAPLLNFVVLAIGSICTFIYLAYVYVRTQSIFVVSIAHIAINNAAQSMSYFAELRDQLLANIGTTLVMLLIVLLLHVRGELKVFHREARATRLS